MSRAFVVLGRREQRLADAWHPSVVAFEAQKPPAKLARIFASTTADAGRLYASLRIISADARASKSVLTRGQFALAGGDLEKFSTRAQALADDLTKLAQDLGVS